MSCYTSLNKTVYTAHHLTTPEKRAVRDRLVKHRNRTQGLQRWNVLLLGTDSMSMSSSIRYLPKTRKYLMEKLKATPMRGYTKVGENTYPCLLPFLSGVPASKAKRSKYFHSIRLIFKDYEENGYTTYFSEDRPDVALFNSYHSGFKKQIADYYIRPLALDLERNINNRSYTNCESNMYLSRLNIDYLKRFITKFNSDPFFAFMFLVELHHDHLELGRLLDSLYLELLKSLEQSHVWQNTILFFFADHGPRFGDVLQEEVGRMEGRLPMLYIALPPGFRRKYTTLSNHIHENSDKLVTSFDIYRTLLDVLGLANGGRAPRGDRGQSLFSPIPLNRTCHSAHVPLQFCSCATKKDVVNVSTSVERTAHFLVDEINNVLKSSSDVCVRLKLFEISYVYELGFTEEDSSLRYYQIAFKTKPGFGLFEGAASFGRKTNKIKLHGPISRMNRYGNQSACVKAGVKRPYCFCKSNLT